MKWYTNHLRGKSNVSAERNKDSPSTTDIISNSLVCHFIKIYASPPSPSPKPEIHTVQNVYIHEHTYIVVIVKIPSSNCTLFYPGQFENEKIGSGVWTPFAGQRKQGGSPCWAFENLKRSLEGRRKVLCFPNSQAIWGMKASSREDISKSHQLKTRVAW